MTREDFMARYGVPEADYYDAPATERLRSTDALEALALLVEKRMDGVGPDDFAVALAKGPVQLVAYTREAPSDAWMEHEAQDVVDRLVEAFDEDFGDPDDTSTVPKAEAAALKASAVALLRSLHVWVCQETWSRVFSVDELREVFADDVVSRARLTGDVVRD